MKFFCKQKLLLFVILISINACTLRKTDSDIYAPRIANAPPYKVQIVDNNVNSQIKRVHLPIISMSDWTEGVMVLDMAVRLIEKSDSSRCEFVDPIVSDESTEVFPFQSYWVIFDVNNFTGGVDHLSSFKGTFFSSDEILPSMFLRKENQASAEFRFGSSLEKTFFKMEDVKISDDRSRVSAHFIEPLAARAFVQTSVSQSTCNIKTYFCRDKDSCENESKYRELAFIHVIQGFLGVPNEVVLGEVK